MTIWDVEAFETKYKNKYIKRKFWNDCDAFKFTEIDLDMGHPEHSIIRGPSYNNSSLIEQYSLLNEDDWVEMSTSTENTYYGTYSADIICNCDSWDLFRGFGHTCGLERKAKVK